MVSYAAAAEKCKAGNPVNIVVTREIWYKGDGSNTLVELWNGVDSVKWLPRPAQEGEDNETIDAAKLEERVLGSNGEHPNYWARWAAKLAKLTGHPPIISGDVGEMMLQQTVYSPDAALLYSFHSVSHSYIAHQHMPSGASPEPESQFLQINGKPDAALLGPNKKMYSEFNAQDMYTCALMTSASALAFRTAARNTNLDGKSWAKIEVPLILGNGETLRLFVARVEHVGAPVI